jgi:ubiquinone/menaquinone biosynthesis C-methylase UbiE
VRTFTPVAAGMGRMSFRTFLQYNFLGAIIWSGGVTILGFYLGRAFPTITDYLSIIVVIVIVISFAPPFVHKYWNKRKKRFTKHGFDVRNVSYEHIHSIKLADFKALIDAIDPQENEVIMDAMCGYAAVGAGILERNPTVKLYLLEESKVQLEKAKDNLSGLDSSRFILAEFPSHKLEPAFFDKIVIKMGLHEVSKEKQLAVAKEVYTLLKPHGKFVIWDIMLSEATQILFQDIIRKKDELSGFDMLARERYFFREDEFMETMESAGFKSVKEFHPISYRFSSRRRLESELHNDPVRLENLNGYIRERFPEVLKKEMDYVDEGENISFNIVKKIFVMQK